MFLWITHNMYPNYSMLPFVLFFRKFNKSVFYHIVWAMIWWWLCWPQKRRSRKHEHGVYIYTFVKRSSGFFFFCVVLFFFSPPSSSSSSDVFCPSLLLCPPPPASSPLYNDNTTSILSLYYIILCKINERVYDRSCGLVICPPTQKSNNNQICLV